MSTEADDRRTEAAVWREAANLVDGLGDGVLEPYVIARMLRARAERIEAGEE